jgi:glycosyltransferase involved in cell wall biosynthesis
VDRRVRLIRQPHGGVAAARNKGIAQARSELIAFVDADDLWDREKIEKQIAALRAAGPRCALVYTWYAIIDEDSRVIDRTYRPFESGDVLGRICRGNLIGNGSSALVTKAPLLEAGGFNPLLRARCAQGCEDYQLYFRIAERHLFALVPEFLTGYRRTPTNMSSDLFQMYRSWMLVTGEMRDRQPKLANTIHVGANLFIAGLLERAVEFRQFKQAHFFAGRLLWRDPVLLAGTLLQSARRALSPLRRRWRRWRGIRAPVRERFAIGDPESGHSRAVT